MYNITLLQLYRMAVPCSVLPAQAVEMNQADKSFL